MSSAHQFKPITVENYLEGELLARNKHEYVDGRVYAMAGAKNVHNRIASRVLIALGKQLSGKCEAYNSDTKIRIRSERRTFLYYPDLSVVCNSNPDNDSFQDQPVVIIEVISESTRRADEGEKRINYLTIPTLDTYILFEQDRREARVFQRTANEFPANNFTETIYSDPNSVIAIPAIEAEIRFDELYAGIEFPESREDGTES